MRLGIPLLEPAASPALQDRESLLLALCARTRVDPPAHVRIVEALAAGIDWPRFLSRAEANQVLPLAGATLCRAHAASCPGDVLRRLKEDVRSNAVRSLMAVEGLGRVVDLLESSGIPVISFKGPLLSMLAYGDPALRAFGDLDVWVHPWDFHHRVPGLLVGHGWAQFADFGFERSYLRAEGGFALDVHQSLTNPRSMPCSLRFDEARDRSIRVTLQGRALRTLSHEDTVIALCVQLAKDASEPHRGLPLIKVCDIAEMIRKHPDLAAAGLVKSARKLGVLKIVCLGCAVAARLLGVKPPPAVRDAGRRMSDLPSLALHIEDCIFNADSSRSRPELRNAAVWNAAIRERLRDRAGTLVALTQDFLAPNERDYAFVRLPRSLDRAYLVVKPVRLLRDYGRRLVDAMANAAGRR
jgi:hypothetical protein